MNTMRQHHKLNIPPFYTMEMMKYAAEREAAGHTIYHLEVGQSIAPTPAPVLEEAARALTHCQLNYCSALGYFDLRKAIAQHYHDTYALDVAPSRIIVTPGSSIGLYIALLMNFNKSDGIAIASPSYPCYRNVIQSLDYSLVDIKTCRENNYLITPDDLANCGQKISGILIASPNNPTGSMYDEQALKLLSAYCEENNILILSDELYHGITYEKKAETILKYNNNAIVINGFSKYFAMTGWRIGWMIVTEEEMGRYESLLQNLILCTSTLTQIAAVKAFSAYDELNAHVDQYKINRDILYDALLSDKIGKIYRPEGGFYIYLELDDIKQHSMDLCKQLLYEHGVAVAPGMDFSSESERCCIRLSFCQSQTVIESAANILHDFIKKI